MLSSSQRSSTVSISAVYRNWLYSLLLLMPMGRLPWAFVTNMNLTPRILLSSWNYYDSAVIIINDSAPECLFYSSLEETYSERTHSLWDHKKFSCVRSRRKSREVEVVWVQWGNLCFIHRSFNLLRSVGMSFSLPWRVSVHQHHWPQKTQPHFTVLQATPPAPLDHNV